MCPEIGLPFLILYKGYLGGALAHLNRHKRTVLACAQNLACTQIDVACTQLAQGLHSACTMLLHVHVSGPSCDILCAAHSSVVAYATNPYLNYGLMVFKTCLINLLFLALRTRTCKGRLGALGAQPPHHNHLSPPSGITTLTKPTALRPSQRHAPT